MRPAKPCLPLDRMASRP